MMDDVQRRRRNRRRLWLVLAAAGLLVAVLVVPPMISIGRYKARITDLMSQSLGRPVRLSSVELRLLPRPEFVLTDLTVEEDPAFGAEPLLHANSVTAAIRLLPLWRGTLAISSVSVDEASLNLVRAPGGRWNLDSLFRTAAAHSRSGAGSEPRPLPYLEATNSRVNIKNGLEKLPFSLVDADISFWQDDPGVWRLRLRGQPARTDVQLDLADTGIVKLEASLHRSPELRQMPIRLDMEWSEAQLGQLSRLIIGSDPGWRGDLTADLHLSGTPDSAKVTTRLRATGVHRAEFAPASPLDFDANCNFDYHYTSRSMTNLACDSPLGDGQVRLAGDLPGNAPPRLSLVIQKVPVQAGLDLLRTLRSGIDEDLEAEGTISGELKFNSAPEATATEVKPAGTLRRQVVKRNGLKGQEKSAETAQALTGRLAVEGFQLKGGALRQPVEIQKIALAPAEASEGKEPALTTEVALPAGGTSPLNASLRLGVHGYQAALLGPVSLDRLRQWTAVAGLSTSSPLDGLSGDAASLQLHAEGPWLPEPEPLFPGNATLPPKAPPPPAAGQENDRLSGTMEFHGVKWKSNFLANDVEISRAVLTLGGNMLVWDPVAFAYGPVKGTGSLQVPLKCEEVAPCLPQVELHFGDLDAGKLEAALLGARKPDTLFSSLLARFQSSGPGAWPQIEGTLKADALMMGPFALKGVTASVRTLANVADVENFSGELLGGTVQGSGTVSNGNQPSYALEGSFEKLKPQAVCTLMELYCKGGTISGDGKLAFAGFAGEDVGATAKGTMHFDWRWGTLTGAATPKALARFDRWTGEAAIAGGAMTLEQNQVRRGRRASPVQATLTFGMPPKLTFVANIPHKPQNGKVRKAQSVK